jgi:hypothetical protein
MPNSKKLIGSTFAGQRYSAILWAPYDYELVVLGFI